MHKDSVEWIEKMCKTYVEQIVVLELRTNYKPDQDG